MKYLLKTILLICVLLLSLQVSAHEPEPGAQAADAQHDAVAAVPGLADIIPLASQLSTRLTALETTLKAGLDMAALEGQLVEIETNFQKLFVQFQRIKTSQDYKYTKLVEFRESFKQEQEVFEKIEAPLHQAIRQLGNFREEWLAEQTRWREWQDSLQGDGELDELTASFARAQATIDKALNLILPQLRSLLRVQEHAGKILETIHAHSSKVDAVLAEERRGTLLNESPPMFSAQYRAQFQGRRLWFALQKGLHEVVWPDNRFFLREGWIVFLQWGLSLVIITIVYRKRALLRTSDHWSFLAARPVAAGLFLGVMATVLLYEYEGAPGTWKLLNTLIAGSSFIRLTGILVDISWKREAVSGLMGLLIATRFMDVLGFPLPLFRLYTFLAALAGLFLCLRWAGQSARQENVGVYPWAFRVSALFFFVIMIAELWGKKSLSIYLLVALIRSFATVLVFMLLMHLIRGGLEWLFATAPFQRAAVLHSDDTETIIRQMARFVNIVIWGLVLLPALLMFWGVYDTMKEAIDGLLAVRFTLGAQPVSIGLLLVAAGILYGAFFLSWLIRTLPLDKMLVKRRVERGIRLSIERLLHYFIIAVGFLWALDTIGFELTQFTIILSALGVGIGFGLQGVVNNFFSGLILLFERPVRMGDYIDVNGERAEIKRIGLRSTTVQTLDQTDVIIPNADLVSNQVTNWTLSSRRVRLVIPVGVAYGSDIALVMEHLLACAKDNGKVAEMPAPQVLFLNFGDSSLDFELRVWIRDVDEIGAVSSELHQEIDRHFREAGIEIPFPQRDLHLRSVDDSAIKGVIA